MEGKNEQTVNTENLKRETVETVNQVKETIKNVDIKNDAKQVTGFATAMFYDPLGTIKELVSDNSNKHFKTAIIFIAIWSVVVFIKALSIRYWSFKILFHNILSLIKLIIAPTLKIIIFSSIVYFMNKENRKSLVTIITAITTAKIPVIVASIISLLTIFATSASKITSPISSVCSAISIVLTYFATKSICGEEKDSKFLKKFVAIEVIYYIAYILISFLGIYI